jgi:hypothetical protein
MRLVAGYSIGQYGGMQHFAREGETRTLCGRDRSNWMDMREVDLSTDLESAWTCKRCAAKMEQK